MGGESGKRSEGRRRHSWSAMSRRHGRAPRSQPPDDAKPDGRGSRIGSQEALESGSVAACACRSA
jgi:hypothetical protein